MRSKESFNIPSEKIINFQEHTRHRLSRKINPEESIIVQGNPGAPLSLLAANEYEPLVQKWDFLYDFWQDALREPGFGNRPIYTSYNNDLLKS
jgi:hypothetical protein